jgi:hypothetical protein
MQMIQHLTSLPVTTFFTSSMSCHTLEWLAQDLVLSVFVVPVVGLVSTSTGEEAKALSGAALATTSLGSTTGARGDTELMSRRSRVEDPAQRRN